MKQFGEKRLILFFVLLGAVFIVIFSLLFMYQIVDGSDYALQATKNNQSVRTVEAARGEIVDRYGHPLASNHLILNIKIYQMSRSDEEMNQEILYLLQLAEENQASWVNDFPIESQPDNHFKDGSEIQAAKLKSALNLQEYATAQNCLDLLQEKYHIDGYNEEDTYKITAIRGQMLMNGFSESTPYIFARDVDSIFAGVLMEKKDRLPDVSVEESYERFYADGTVAPHILGMIGPIYQEEYAKYKDKGYSMNAVVGKSGIEAKFEEDLKGINGTLTIVKNDEGQIVDEYYAQGQEPKPGHTVVLTLDKELQSKTQDALANFILSLRGAKKSTKGGAAAVLDIHTGEALALATYPGYDINEYTEKYNELQKDPYNPLFNRVLMGIYRPGSTFKTGVSVAALTEGLINENTYFNCKNPFIYYNHPFSCLQIKHSGPTNIYTALQRSCNIYFYNAGDLLGIDKINTYAHALGLGVDTGLEITTQTGHIASPEYYKKHGLRWEQGYVIQTAIGQAETMVTPLQMATEMMTIANHGKRYATHLIKAIRSYDYTQTISETKPSILSELEDKNRAYDITIGGMKLMAQTVSNLSGYDIAAKSGSPEYYQNGVYKTNSAAVAIYPAENPEIAVSIMIEEGENAPNLLRSIIDAYEETKMQAQTQNLS